MSCGNCACASLTDTVFIRQTVREISGGFKPGETDSTVAPQVRSVWLMETGELAPRFISAYPLPA
jgi:hypothetical protein